MKQRAKADTSAYGLTNDHSDARAINVRFDFARDHDCEIRKINRQN